MENIQRLFKVVVILLGIICMGISFSGCIDFPKTLSDFIIIQLQFVNTLLLIGVLAYLIWRFGFKKMENIQRLFKVVVILLGIICMGISFSGCIDFPKTLSDFIIIQLQFVNTLLLIGVLAYLIWRFGFKK